MKTQYDFNRELYGEDKTYASIDTIPQTDWLFKGLSDEQIYKERIEALEEVIRYFEWRPYPKEKPTENGRYLVTIMAFNNEYAIDILYWGKSWECEEVDKSLKRKKGYWYTRDIGWGDHAVDNVVAWRPVPRPYAPNE